MMISGLTAMTARRALVAALLGMAAACTAVPQGQSPYAGQQARSIKALSAEEYQGLLAGAGLGHAKAAELNRYPGPMHALEMVDALQLTPAQRGAIEEILRAHKAEARTLGAQVVRLEKELDAEFVEHRATPASIDEHTRRIAEASARLRASHLRAHVATTAALSPAQVDRYVQVRGYAAGDAVAHQH